MRGGQELERQMEASTGKKKCNAGEKILALPKSFPRYCPYCTHIFRDRAAAATSGNVDLMALVLWMRSHRFPCADNKRCKHQPGLQGQQWHLSVKYHHTDNHIPNRPPDSAFLWNAES